MNHVNLLDMCLRQNKAVRAIVFNKRKATESESRFFTPHTSKPKGVKALTFVMFEVHAFILSSKLLNRCVSPEQSFLCPPSLL